MTWEEEWQTAVKRLKTYGILEGVKEDTWEFEPHRDVNRNEMAVTIDRTINFIFLILAVLIGLYLIVDGKLPIPFVT